MRKRYRVDSETLRLQATDGSERIVLEVSRTGRSHDSAFIGRSSARAVHAGQGRSSSSSSAASGSTGPGMAQAAAGGVGRYRIKLSD
jgi:hypothetical protein